MRGAADQELNAHSQPHSLLLIPVCLTSDCAPHCVLQARTGVDRPTQAANKWRAGVESPHTHRRLPGVLLLQASVGAAKQFSTYKTHMQRSAVLLTCLALAVRGQSPTPVSVSHPDPSAGRVVDVEGPTTKPWFGCGYNHPPSIAIQGWPSSVNLPGMPSQSPRPVSVSP